MADSCPGCPFRATKDFGTVSKPYCSYYKMFIEAIKSCNVPSSQKRAETEG